MEKIPPFIWYFLLHRKYLTNVYFTCPSFSIYPYWCHFCVPPTTKEKDGYVWQNNLLWLYFLQESHGANTKHNQEWIPIFIFLFCNFPVLCGLILKPENLDKYVYWDFFFLLILLHLILWAQETSLCLINFNGQISNHSSFPK